MYDSYVQENMNYLLWQYMMYERTLSILRARMVFNLHTISYVYVRTTTLARVCILGQTRSRSTYIHEFHLLQSMHTVCIQHTTSQYAQYTHTSCTTTAYYYQRVIILLRIRVVVCIHVQVYAYYELVLSMQSIVCICIQCTLVYTRICRDFSFRSFYCFIYSMTSKHQDQSRDESQSVHVLQSQPSPKQITIRLPYLQGGSIA